MPQRRHRKTKILFYIAMALAIPQTILAGFLLYLNFTGEKKAVLGATFSPSQARYLGLDPKKVLADSIHQLGIKDYRISAYWNVIEPKRGKFDFSEIDWQLDEIERHGGSVILAIGMRLPRWPECHPPKWATVLDERTRQERILAMLTTVVNHYKGRPVIKAWQMENEPFLSIFGECPKPDEEFYEKELKLVRSLDSRPVVMTESGELSTWLRAASLADIVGISLYRVVWNRFLGTLYYPLTPAYYRYKAHAIIAMGKKIFVSELQAEPWERGIPLPETPLAEQKAFIDGKKVMGAINFAKKAGFNEIYLWGVEWWQYMREQGDPELWDTMRAAVIENQ